MNQQLNIYRVNFTAPLHISDIRSDYNTSEKQIHSDTLYAAIMEAWAMLGKSDWITDNPDFALSSMLPFTNTDSGEYVYFFPKPFKLPVSDKNKQDTGVAKKFKKVQYLDLSFYENLLNNNYQASENDIKGVYITSKNIDKDFISAQLVPRIRWHRNEAENAEPFNIEKLYFNNNSGFWFIFNGNDEVKIKVETAMHYLSESGLGTDRNVGNGSFKWQSDSLSLDLPDKSGYCTNLSLFSPRNPEQLKDMIDDKSGYDFIRRGGWIGEPYNTYRKRTVFMFSEGSVFKKDIEGIMFEGNSHDLKPGNTPIEITHPVHRIGKAVFLPIQIG